VTLNPESGEIASLIHKATGTETFSAPGNQLQAFKDAGQYWDAWNIAPDYQDHPLEGWRLVSMQWVEHGLCWQVIRVVKTFNQSTFMQDYALDATAAYLRIRTTVDWQETQVLVKAAFPLTVSSSQATYEIPFGAIQRSTNPQTPEDKAKWEVPALRWADMSQLDESGQGRGVSILTDYKHGFDATPNQLRLTLLKAPLWPDPTADRGQQTFTYAIYPHDGGWQNAKTVQQARNLNLPVMSWVGPTSSRAAQSTATVEAKSFLDFGDTTWVLSAFKRSEDEDGRMILRGYESAGMAGTLTLGGCLNLAVLTKVDGLEQPINQPTNPDAELALADRETIVITPWQVVSQVVIQRVESPASQNP
jgi:alpha-mannosidase